MLTLEYIKDKVQKAKNMRWYRGDTNGTNNALRELSYLQWEFIQALAGNSVEPDCVASIAQLLFDTHNDLLR